MKKNASSRFRSLFLSFFLLSSTLVIGQDLSINEVMASNNIVIADEDGDFSDWVEIYNYGAAPLNLQGFGISDDALLPFKWVFPAQTIQPGEYLLVWASSKDRVIAGQQLHTNFQISSVGEAISLTSPTNNLVDQAPSVVLQTDVSYGRQPNGTGSYLFFYTSTPGASNIGTGLTELLLPPIFSHESGLYTSGFDLALTHNNPGVQIIYTLDGSEPTLSNLTGTIFEYKNEYPTQINGSPGPILTDSYTSNTYMSQINIYDRSSDPDQLALKNTRQHDIYTPINPVRKATVVKAKAFVNGIGSKTIAKTFFVWSQGNPYEIPVISLQIQEDYLFDYDDGIYNAGVDFDTWRAANPTNNQYWRASWNNYWRRGPLWEYPVNVEFFESNPTALNTVMSINAGLRIHGNNSRSLGIKNLRLYARSEYDSNNLFEHDLFDDIIPGSTLPNNDFKRILLRGDGSGGPIAYDVVFNNVMQPIYNGVTRIKPAIHFVNGEYWGLTALRDRFDDRHFALNFGLNEDNIAIIDCKGSNCGLDEGTSADYSDFNNMRDFITNNDMSDQTQFDQAVNMMDMSSFIDHIVMEIYAANDSYERKFWRATVPENTNLGDGKWRLTVQDFEASLKDNTNWMDYYADITGSPNSAFLGHLLANDGFKTQFINRFADVLNTVFTTEYFNNVVNQSFDEVTPYLLENENRFPINDFYEQSEKQDLLDWGTTRHTIQQDQIKDYFSITEVLDLTLDVSNTSAGSVTINTIDIKPSTPGVTQNPYPWIGQYFHNIPVTLEAVALPGHSFSHWSGDVSGTNPVLAITPTSDMQIQANFDAIVNPEQVVYFWLMDGELQNDTPFENLDATYAVNGLDATIVYNSCLVGYPFAIGNPNWRKASLERKNEPTALNYYPEANNNVVYANANLRGVQVRQPFRFGALENNLVFEVPTTDFENIKLSLAVMSNGGAETMLLEYWDGSQWITDDINSSSQAITGAYQILEFDFSNVVLANNNINFMIRMRFDGIDMFVDNSDEVIINNIALSGGALLSTDKFNKLYTVKVYPNPTSNSVKVETSEKVDAIVVYNIYGQEMHKYSPTDLKSEINMEDFSKGIYLIKVVSNDSEQTIRVIKQ